MSIDDLFALPEPSRLGGTGPFVINLSASSAPVDVPKAGIDGAGRAVLYRIQRLEDRRPRYRLRLGPFFNEDDADAMLAKVRDIYPGALTATADADDLRAIANLQAKAESATAGAAAQTARSMAPGAAMPPVAKVVPSVAVVPVAATPPVVKVAPAAPVVRVMPAPAVPAVPAVPAAAFILELLEDLPRVLPPASQASVVAKAEGARRFVVPAATKAPPPAEGIDTHVLSMESTQTVRPLTTGELKSEEVLRWFVIQLSLSAHPFDPETVPDLDIFSVYRLYSVAGIDQGQILHALRLGFFAEESAAIAVASYLEAYYDKPLIKRVSMAERDRFANQRLEARKNVGATGKNAIIEITDERFVREKRTAAAASARKAPPVR